MTPIPELERMLSEATEWGNPKVRQAAHELIAKVKEMEAALRQIAEMSNIEACLDGLEARETARQALNEQKEVGL